MESGLRTPDTPADPAGLIVMVRDDPASAARSIAHDLHASLAIGGEETEQALARIANRQLEAHDLDGLAAAMRRADLVRDETRVAARARLSNALNTKVAIHPDTVRRAAAELVAAEAALAVAIQRDARWITLQRRLRLAFASASLLVGGAIAAAAIPAIGAAVAVAGCGTAVIAASRSRRAAEPEHTSLRSHCEFARRRWEQVAGTGADPANVDQVIRRYDPQDDLVEDLVANSPAVRAAERAATHRRMAWVTAWRHEVGDETPMVDPVTRQLLQRDETELWLTGASDLRNREESTLVVAAPYADLPEERARLLHQQLLALTRGQRVIVVIAPEAGRAGGGPEGPPPEAAWTGSGRAS